MIAFFFRRITLLLAFVTLFIAGSGNARASSDQGVRLIVLITIDGLSGDLLNRYSEGLTGGFYRLQQTGYSFSNAWVDHGITVSHSGHVSIATGQHPSTHGIVDAAFYIKANGTPGLADAFADSNYHIVGFPDWTSVSPRHVQSTGLAEWVARSNARARTLCVGTGNISSALYCYERGQHVYWYSPDIGRYVTSSFYLQEYPEWINNFNERKVEELKKASVTWQCLVPESLRFLCNPDNYKHESNGTNQTFPHNFASELAPYFPDSVKEQGLNYWFAGTPFADRVTLELAKTGISALALGQDTQTDFLSIVLSNLDNTCHYYGVSSLETMDVLFQMDQTLGSFFSYLDSSVGKDNYIVALSSDHGFPEIPEQTKEQGKWSRRISKDEIETVMRKVEILDDQQKICKMLKGYDFVADAYTTRQLADTSVTDDEFLRLYRKSFQPARIPRLPFFSLKNFESSIAAKGIMIRLKPNAMINLDVAIHGSPYDYDRYVPLYFMGSGILAGLSNKKVSTIDIAPTLAALADIEIEASVDGQVLLQIRQP